MRRGWKGLVNWCPRHFQAQYDVRGYADNGPLKKKIDKIYKILIQLEKIMTAGQGCIQCGICCERWGWNQKGVVEDLIPWIAHNRTDILQHVRIKYSDGRKASGTGVLVNDLDNIARIYYWQDPKGKTLRRCPFFRRSDDGKAWCGIHAVKPRVCREFTPWNWKNLEYYGNCPACREKAP